MPRPFLVLGNGDVLIEEGADCALCCDHCSYGLAKRRRRQRLGPALLRRVTHLFGRDRSRQGEIVSAFARLVEGLDTPAKQPVNLAGWDVLEYDGLWRLLEVLQRAGRRARIVSPGLRLADPFFAARLSAFHPELTLTYLTTRAALYEHLVGRPGVGALVERAMANLRALGLPFEVNFIATSGSFRELHDVAAYLLERVGLPRFSLLYLAPAPQHFALDPRAGDRLVPYAALDLELRRFVARHSGLGRELWLWRVPPCRLDQDVITSDTIRFVRRDFDDPYAPSVRLRPCAECRFAERCFFVSRYYQQRHPHEVYDPTTVNRLIDQIRG